MSDIERLERLNLIVAAAQETAKTFRELNNNFKIEDIKKAAKKIVADENEMIAFITTVLIPDDEEFLAKRIELKKDANRLSKYYNVDITIVVSKITIINQINYLSKKCASNIQKNDENESKEITMNEKISIKELIERLNVETMDLQMQLTTSQTEKTALIEENESLKQQLSAVQEELVNALTEADKYRAMSAALLKYKNLVDNIMSDIEDLNHEFNSEPESSILSK